MDEKSTELGEINENRKVKREKKGWRDGAATLSDFYPSTCLMREDLGLPGV